MGGVLGQFEGGGVVHVLVGARDQRPDGQERGLELVSVEAGAGLSDDLFGFGGEFVGDRRHGAIAVTFEHREGAVDEVAQAVGQFGRIARLETGIGPVAIGADVQFAQDIKAEGVHAPLHR